MSRPGHAAVLPRSKSTAVIVHPEYHHTLPVEPVKLSFWECCDDHVLLNIASRLEDAKALTNLQLVNRRCRHIVDDDELWRRLCTKKFNCPPQFAESGFSWRELYKFNHEAFKYLLAQTAAEALMKLGIRATTNNYVLNMHGLAS
eukprot:GHUV01007551.1.p1 GENE.GHUV01007551.1~~GHUV01007551.1.p1  ORF type:complete len:145 (+),score=32.14 GHUV01007551.1:622-1056(+)